MKTTIEIPDDLLIEAKAIAARRRTTLKEVVTGALRREIGRIPAGRDDAGDRLVVGPFNILRLRPRGASVTDAMVRGMLTAADEEAFERAVQTSGKR